MGLDPAHPVQYALAVAVGSVHHHHIHTCLGQQIHAFFGAGAHPYSGAHTQAACFIPRGVGKRGLFGDVLHRDQTLEFERIVDHQQPLELVLVQQRLGLGRCGALPHGNELFPLRHDVAHRHVQSCFKPQVPSRDNPHYPACINHGKAGDAKLIRQLLYLQHRGIGSDHHRITQNAGFVALDFGHMRCLLLRSQVLVNDADATLLSHGNSQARLGHGIHGCGYQWQVKGNGAGQAGLQRCIFGQNLGVRGHQKDVIKRECFSKQTHGESPKNELYPPHHLRP